MTAPAAGARGVLERRAADWERDGGPALLPALDGALGAVLRGVLDAATCRAATEAVVRARAAWTADFGGEQFALGRAFYTHFETDQAALYFAEAAASDARVEAALPGMQARLRALYGRLVGGLARPRLGFCGAGVHVFPAHGKVAREGGVEHFDAEGLAPVQLARGARTATIVLMLQPPAWGGGLWLWDARYEGREAPTAAQLAAPRRLVRYGPGDLLFTESLRLHQIRPFRGDRDRISITLHGVEVDRGVWDTWF